MSRADIERLEQIAFASLADTGNLTDVVRAILTALREPSERQRIVALNVGLPSAGDPPLYEMVWQAMIDEVLRGD